MNLLSVNSLAKIGREAPLFTDVTFGLDEGEKAALIGRNGSGKSTLLNCIAGVLESDSGTAVLNKAAGVSFLPQNPVFNPDDTITDHIFGADSPKLSVIKKYESLCADIAKYSESANGSTSQTGIPHHIQKEFDDISDEMTRRDLWNYENSVTSILSVLGITDFSKKMSTLSGGMIKKVALAHVLVEDTKLLLLDEPTNHLDVATIAWLEEYLRTTPRAVLMVTHDRYFLDHVCSSIYELDNKKLVLYKGNFSIYLEKKEIEMEIAANTERRIESVLRTERDWLMRGPCARGTKARARVDNIHRLINREKLAQTKGFEFEVSGRRLGGKILEISHISKSYNNGALKLITDFSYIFKKGEKIGVFGDNGSGKSTLLDIVTQKITPDSGTVEPGINTAFGYYQQNPYFEDTTLTVLEYIIEAAEYITMNNGKQLGAAQFLEQFGFTGKIQHSPISSLSGGERKRVYLVRILMSNPNFLVLDEPTNDFDIFTMSILESFLQNFAGCLLVVSHDRYFMDKIADTLFIMEEDGSISGYVGSCSEYIDYRNQVRAEEKAAEKSAAAAVSGIARKVEGVAQTAEDSSTAAHKANAAFNPPSAPEKRKRTYKEQKEFEAVEEEIALLEDRKTELDGLLSGGETDHQKLAELGREYADLEKTLEAKYGRWEELGLISG